VPTARGTVKDSDGSSACFARSVFKITFPSYNPNPPTHTLRNCTIQGNLRVWVYLCHLQGAQLETAMGPARFARCVTLLLLGSHVMVVALSLAAAAAVPQFFGGAVNSCSIGFSAVLFAMKVILGYDSPGWSSAGGIMVPTKVLKNHSLCCA
jgi:hypothetical protein